MKKRFFASVIILFACALPAAALTYSVTNKNNSATGISYETPLMRIQFSSETDCVLNSLSFSNLGTAPDDAYSAIYIVDADEETIASTQLTNRRANIYFTNATVSGTNLVYVYCSTSTNAKVGYTCGFSFIAIDSECTQISGILFVTSNTLITNQGTLTVDATNTLPRYVYRGTTNITAQMLYLSAGGNVIRITNITFINNSASDADISLVRIYRETDGDYACATNDMLLYSGTFSGGSINFDTDFVVYSPGVRLYVILSVPSGATVGDSVSVGLSAMRSSAVSYSGIPALCPARAIYNKDTAQPAQSGRFDIETSTSTTSLELSWDAVTASDLSHYIVVRYTNSAASGSPQDGAEYETGRSLFGNGMIVYKGTSLAFEDAGLDYDPVYYYTLYACSKTLLYSQPLVRSNSINSFLGFNNQSSLNMYLPTTIFRDASQTLTAQLNFMTDTTEDVTVYIVTTLGAEVARQTINVSGNIVEVIFNDLNLTSGTYVIFTKSKSSESVMDRFIVVR